MTKINSIWIQNFNRINIKLIELFNLNISNIIFILSVFLTVIIIRILIKSYSCMNNEERDKLEIFWTILPTIIITIISFPSIIILYNYEENKFCFIDVKIIGNQWYWTYEYPNKIFIESYIKKRNLLRVINSNNSLIIPSNKYIRLIISSNDVIHSWTIPRIIRKMDAVPGRLNIIFIKPKKRILIKGQCSEICGINHRFIPISLFSIKI